MADPSGRDLHRDLQTLTTYAKRDLRDTLARARTDAHARAMLMDLLPAMIDQYGSAAATAAADWYDEVRSEQGIRGRFQAIVPDPGDPGAQALVGWAASKAQDLTTFESLVLGGYTRRILQYGRSTVARSAIADPGASGWQRQGVGKTCDFCLMLITRGAVYSENTADFASHDHCGCVAVVAWRGQETPVRLDEDGTRATTSARADRTDPEQRRASNERARAWIDANAPQG